MKIFDLYVNNFRTFKNLNFASLPNLVILVGRNSTGKTSFLDIFSFVKDVIVDIQNAFYSHSAFLVIESKTAG